MQQELSDRKRTFEKVDPIASLSEVVEGSARPTFEEMADNYGEPSLKKQAINHVNDAPLPQTNFSRAKPAPKAERLPESRPGKGGKKAFERRRVRSRNDEADEARRTGTEPTPEKDGEEASKRLAKRKIALLISFCGTGCHGMQC